MSLSLLRPTRLCTHSARSSPQRESPAVVEIGFRHPRVQGIEGTPQRRDLIRHELRCPGVLPSRGAALDASCGLEIPNRGVELVEKVLAVIALCNELLLMLLGYPAHALGGLQVLFGRILDGRDSETVFEPGNSGEHLEPVRGDRIEVLSEEYRLGSAHRIAGSLEADLRANLLQLRGTDGIHG